MIDFLDGEATRGQKGLEAVAGVWGQLAAEGLKLLGGFVGQDGVVGQPQLGVLLFQLGDADVGHLASGATGGGHDDELLLLDDGHLALEGIGDAQQCAKGEELADVVNYCLVMADQLDVDLEEIILRKLEKNIAKYPVEKAKGRNTKYDKL